MNDLVSELRVSAHDKVEARLADDSTDCMEWQAADLIEQQQQRIAELEQREAKLQEQITIWKRVSEDLTEYRDKLAATLERIRKIAESKQHGVSDLLTVIRNNPSINLNHLKQSVAVKSFMAGIFWADQASLEDTNEEAAAEEHANKLYPDTE